jgi:hypothetical protein
VSQPASELPPGHASFSQTGVDEGETVHYELPDGWEVVPAIGIRKAAFRIRSEDREALVTVIAFSANAGPKMADPLANVNRWRSEVGLEPIAETDLQQATEPIQIGDLPATYVEAIPKASLSAEQGEDHGTLAAMVPGGEVVWFFKIAGQRDLVVAQREAFKSFLWSVRFTTRNEPSDGN